jgi:hypothetical protein
MYIIGLHFMGVHLMAYLMGVYLMDVYLINLHLTGVGPRRAAAAPKLLGALGALKGVPKNLNHLEIIIDQEILFRTKESTKFIPV